MATIFSNVVRQKLQNQTLVVSKMTFDDTDDYATGGVAFTPTDLTLGRIVAVTGALVVDTDTPATPLVAIVDIEDNKVIIFNEVTDTLTQLTNEADISDLEITLTVVGY